MSILKKFWNTVRSCEETIEKARQDYPDLFNE